MAIQTTNERILYSQGGQEAGQFGYQGLPPEEALAQRALARKQQIANILMMKMMKGGPKAGLMGQPRPPDPGMGTGYGPSPDPVMGTGYVSPMTQQMRGRGI